MYLLDLYATDLWPFSAFWTLVVALIAGIGAAALYFGHDPTDEAYRRTTT